MNVNKEKEKLLSYEDAHALFYQDKDTGTLHWKAPRAPRCKPGDIAGWIDNKGYRVVEVEGRSYRCHRLVWLMHHGSWPENSIDHINRDRLDNRIENLRDVSNMHNCRNRNLEVTNKSGHTGVSWHKASNRWTAQISVNRKVKYLGIYLDKEDAIKARKEAEEKYWSAA